MADREIDARGLSCPIPVLKAKDALKEMTDGVLTVIVDNEDSSKNVSWSAQKAGYESVIERRGDDWAVRIRVSESQPAAADEVPVACPTAQSVVAFVAADRVGRGDDELGGILMKSFLHSLGQLDRPPQSVVFMNAGVRLAMESSDALESIRALASAGVQIIVCGTCLDFFGLRDRLAAGRVSNMYEIVETLANAGSVIAV
jgi:selenium metabolism protein YedF